MEEVNMRYELIGDSNCPMAKVALGNGETIKLERGAMAYMVDVDISGKMNSKGGGLGGFVGAIGRSLTSGESMFITEAVGKTDSSEIGIASATMGKITRLQVGERQYRLNTGAYLASDSKVNYKMVRQKISAALFGGTGGLFVMETEGYGDVLVNAFGDMIEIEVTPERPVVIDNDHVVAWDKSLNYNIKVASGTFGFTTGEGLVNSFTGSGKVIIQTRNLASFAGSIRKYMPAK